MRKITSFMFMLMLCCISAFAQTATEYKDKLIKVGTAQAQMQPNTWYFVHTPRNPDQNASDHVMPGNPAAAAGGLVTDRTTSTGLTTTEKLTEMCAEEGINANEYMANLLRFVPVQGEEGAFYIEFGNGRFMAASPANGSVTKNQQIAGQAGKYNFYLIKINGEPNQAGRFAWNVYNMQARIDNNGAGNNVNPWSEGERVASDAESTPADGSNIKSNNVWQIYDVEVLGDVNLYDAEVTALLDTHSEISGRQEGNYIDNLKAGINVGNSYGNYRPEDVEAFLVMADEVEILGFEVDGGIGIDYVYDKFPTLEDLQAYHNAYKAADKKVTDNKIPLAVNNIENGYYTLNNILRWVETVNDTIRYTQTECDSINDANGNVPGDEGYLTPDSVKEVNSSEVLAKVKSLFSKNNADGAPYLAWGEQKKSAAYLWKIEKVAGSETKYRLVNQFAGLTFKSVASGTNTPLIQDDTVAVYFDFRGKMLAPVPQDSVIVYSIRNTYNTAESGKNCYVHCGGHNSGKGKEGWTVGWAGSPEASLWYLTRISDQEAEEWMSSDADKLKRMLAEADKVMKSAPGQLQIAKDILVTIFDEDSVVTDAAQFKGFETILDGTNTDPQDLHPAKGSAEETLEYLLDGDNRTYWHTKWAGGNKPAHTHYLQVEASDPLVGAYAVKITRRSGADNDHATKLAVRGYDEDNSELTFDDGVDLGVLNIPFSAKGKIDASTNYFEGKGKQIIRFYWEASNGSNQRGYWHASGFNVYRAEVGTVHSGNSQYKVREAQVKALEAAMAKWEEGEFGAVTDPEMVKDEAFLAAYNALIEANKAWAAVYVDPTALRNAIKAAPAENIFVQGNNPGQWAAGATTPTAIVDQAKAYDKACAYSSAESEKFIKDIQDATAQAYAAANKVETGKWYRFRFPAEKMYDDYGWSKNGAKAVVNESEEVQTSPALFGKVAVAAKSVKEYYPYTNDEGEADTLAMFSTVAADELVEGNGVYFFADDDLAQFENGEDLFRFIAVDDTTFMIQNKATGLFLHGQHYVELNAVPTYFTVKAIGAGANIVSFTDVLGGKPNAHVNLHGQRDDNRLVCWEANTLGSNSSILIETVSSVTENPANTYTAKLWPGSVYTKVSPVDTKVIKGATAYGAELVLGEDTTVVLKAIESGAIAAGTPYVIIADLAGDYISPADRKNEIIAEIIAEENQYGFEQKDKANTRLNEEYEAVEMEHGMEVDTIQRGLGHLVGTFRNLTVKAGKALVAKENGFAHTLINTTIDANRAYLACDFDPESADVLGSIAIKVEGSVDTGIDNILNNVAKSGDIYTVDGKLVGKGNINTINRLPAGVYIINGMKVVKK